MCPRMSSEQLKANSRVMATNTLILKLEKFYSNVVYLGEKRQRNTSMQSKIHVFVVCDGAASIKETP